MADAVIDEVVQDITSTQDYGALTPDYLLQIIGAALCVAFTTEFINWYLIFRHEEFKDGVKKVIQEQEKVDDLRAKHMYNSGGMSSNQLKVHTRKLEAAEQYLKSIQQGVMWQKTKGTLFVGALTMIFVGMMNSSFSGTIVARLPFEPF